MKTWHIRVADADGQALEKSRAFLRYLLSWVWFLPPLLLMQWLNAPLSITLLACPVWIVCWSWLSYFHKDRQFWHDHWAGTRLMDVRPVKIDTV
jgi:uncharacterized RDD family membrane protein YckC